MNTLFASTIIALWLIAIVATVGAIVRQWVVGSDTDPADRLERANAAHDDCPVHHASGDNPK